MSDLRKNLQAAKQEYQSLKYPGDLAADVFAQYSRPNWGLRLVVTSLAAAAMVLIALRLRPAATVAPDQPMQIAMVTETQTEEPTTQESETKYLPTLSDIPALSAPAIPSGFDLAPTPPDFSFSAPSFSLLGNESSQSTSTTKESV